MDPDDATANTTNLRTNHDLNCHRFPHEPLLIVCQELLRLVEVGDLHH